MDQVTPKTAAGPDDGSGREMTEDEVAGMLCLHVYGANRAFSRFYQTIFADTGFTYPKFVVLMTLTASGPMSVSRLSSEVGVEPNTVSPIVKRMAEVGLVTRERAKDDERRVDIAITPLGTQVFERAEALVRDGFAALDLDPAAVQRATDFLTDASARLDRAAPPRLDLSDLI